MDKFLRTSEIVTELINIIENAKEELILVSPYIKLDKNVRMSLSSIKKSNIKIIVVYGNEKKEKDKNLSDEDLDFLKGFPNIEIRYIDNLHGKYYTNENKAILTSMNLYDSSKNNTEFGILLSNKNDLFLETKEKILKAIKLYKEIYSSDKAENNKENQNSAKSDKNKQDTTEKCDYIEFIAKVNNFYKNTDGKSQRTESKEDIPFNIGYCIRTGKQIPFDIEMPYCPDAFKEWRDNSNDENFPEKYCHWSGEKFKGKTSKARPILYKNWKKLIWHYHRKNEISDTGTLQASYLWQVLSYRKRK